MEDEASETRPEESQPSEMNGDEDACAEVPAEEQEEESEIDRMKTALRESHDHLLRKQAEFDNFRKRNERERQDYIKYAAGELLVEILPVLDNLERAIEAPASGTEDRLHEGISIIHRQFIDILQKAGLREVEGLGREFDPHVHEAVGHVETNEHPESEILEVYQKGYFFKDRLLRPALVNVAKSVKNIKEAKEAESGKEVDSSKETEQVEPDSSP